MKLLFLFALMLSILLASRSAPLIPATLIPSTWRRGTRVRS
jgi:hypothetical protein